MTKPPRTGSLLLASAIVTSSFGLAGCATASQGPLSPLAPESSAVDEPELPTLLYIGSSTVANFLREAEPIYGRARFALDTIPESVGGEIAIQERHVELAGIATHPSPQTLDLGVQATLVGTDTLAVVVNVKNPVTRLTLAQLKGIFTGAIRNWKEVGGPDLSIQPFIVGKESATHRVFRSLVLGGADYMSCEVVRPDQNLPMTIEAEPGGIGMISHSFLCSGGEVRVLAVEGESPLPSNVRYPIARPLYLLWWPGNPTVTDFIAWASTEAAAKVRARCFGPPRTIRTP